MIWTRKFWKATGARALHTVSQTFVALIPTTAISLGEINWGLTLSGSVLAGVVSVAKSISLTPPEVE